MGINTVKNTAIEKKKDAAALIRDHGLFWCLFLGMGIYYIWRMFSLPPWYDELYTYENFIDRGMIYSMIHWPLPNNHVFYSALSAILNKLGNPYIGLRGVSFLASMGSLLLLYRILKKGISPRMAAAGTALFAAMYNVVQQAAQGRGYALSGFFLLAAVNCLYEICIPEKTAAVKEKRRFWYYAGFTACLTGGLYTIPSNLYWVVSVCMAGGLYLLFTGEYKKLFRLVIASAAAAIVTFGLYTIIWLAIGSNFLVKEEASAFYGMSHFQVLKTAPFAAFSRGMEAMLRIRISRVLTEAVSTMNLPCTWDVCSIRYIQTEAISCLFLFFSDCFLCLRSLLSAAGEKKKACSFYLCTYLCLR